ncbi:tetratricopeptide repeat protein [Pseudoduganella namucuonensis]|uniref:Tetratricopeptide repeat protein n=1 Tax=Pseudoduganella namucuonensis TaxID=1035707 RepID=A0A1I7FSB7_9BURK|nr:tetratricopeptide repeat protein [Pseudoduganella namucuonensis]SFU39114.1 hypothetical protein SAMN05216552_1002255 [Pseudoduganella namucuonensis]
MRFARIPFPPRRLPAALLSALLAAALAGPARAQAPAPEAPPPDGQVQDLYQEALQSIAEGRKNDANATLQRVVDKEPLHAGAWLDLALLQCSLGRPKEAERLFNIIEQRFDPPAGIVQLIADTRTNGCGDWTPLSQYSVSLARGIDQNVNQGSTRDLGVNTDSLTPEFRPQHDQYTMLSADYMRDLTPNGTLGFAQFQGRRNDQLSQYDSSALFFGAETPWRFGRWTVRGTVLAGFVTLGSKFYQRQVQLQGRVGPPVPLPYSLQFHMVGSVSRIGYVTLENFDSTTGELRAMLSRRSGDTSVSASVGAQRDRAIGDRPGGDRDGVSVNLNWRHRYGGGVTADFGYSLQTWRSSTPYAPTVIEQVRDQRTHTLRGTFTYPVTRNQNLILELRQVVNKENIPIFQYNNRQLQLSWQWQGL